MIKNKCVAMFALFIAIAFVMTSGCTEADDATNMMSSDNGNNVPDSDDATTSSVTMPKDPNVFDKAYTQYLLDQVMYSVRNNPESLENMENRIAMEIKGEKTLTWAPEKMSFSKNKGISGNSIYFGLDGGLEDFYAGPVVCWTKEDPNAPVTYNVAFSVITGGRYQSYGEEPYKYGVEKYSDPPPEVLKVFSDKGVTLHY